MLSSPEYDLNLTRQAFDIHKRGMTYLNHASLSPLPRAAVDEMIETIRIMAEKGSAIYEEVMEPLLAELLQNIGTLINAGVDEITFVQNTATGLNLIANSLPLEAGDTILFCDVEFPTNVYPWTNLAHKGIGTRILPAKDGGLSIDELEEARDERSRIVAVSGIQFFTGRKEDIAALGAYCHAHGMLLVVDAIQSAGISPIDMRAMGIDAITAGAQKALLGPPGIGFMAIRRELIETMHPAFLTPLSFEGWEEWLVYDKKLAGGARKFDTSTANITGLAGFNESLKLLLNLGVSSIDQWVTHLSDVAIKRLAAIGLPIITPIDPHFHANIVTFAWPGDVAGVVTALEHEGIIISARNDSARIPHLRISSHCYNTEEEIIHVIDRLEGMR